MSTLSPEQFGAVAPAASQTCRCGHTKDTHSRRVCQDAHCGCDRFKSA
jgi:hypothetical protein